MKEPPFYILSCNGGGVKGLITVSFLYHMSKYLKTIHPSFALYDFFDMYAGTSIGSFIILALLVNKYDEEQLRTVMSKENCKAMIDKTIWDKMLGIIQPKPKYDGINKKTMIQKYLGNHKFHTLEKHVIIPTYNISQKRAYVFDRSTCNEQVLSADIVDASSSVPAYFPCVKIKHSNKKNCPLASDWFIDGGMVANNPTICAIARARKILGPSQRKIIVVNIMNGYKADSINGEKAVDYGGVEWLQHGILNIAMDESIVIEQAQNLLDKNCYIDINGPLGDLSEELDNIDDSNLDALSELGHTWWLQQKHKFEIIKEQAI